MYEIIYMKADYEPWWQFEGWESTIISKRKFMNIEECNLQLEQLLGKFRAKYNHEESREETYYAFWSEEERNYCDACDEDSQIYHGIIVRKSESVK